MPEHDGIRYLDDRMYILTVVRCIGGRPVPSDPLGSGEGGPYWLVSTRRNVPGLRVTRGDAFDTREEAIAYMEELEVATPRVSLDGRAPDPLPSLEAHRRWLQENNLKPSYIEPAPDICTKT